MNDRVLNKKIDVNYDNITRFFDERGGNNDLVHKYNYVLFQDNDPELAVKRDRQEKEKISAYLPKDGNGKCALDLGCGIGRWGEYLLPRSFRYTGIDASSAMIGRAEENLQNFPDKSLIVGSLQEMISAIELYSMDKQFDMIFINGVFMYLNDNDYEKVLNDIPHLCKDHCLIYVKESMGIKERLTLNGIYSMDLLQTYSAIYRSVDEYRATLNNAFSEKFRLIADGMLFDSELNNRKETEDYYFIYQR